MNNKNNPALIIAKEARNNTFVDCDIHGAKVYGAGTKMIRTKIHQFKQEHAFTYWLSIVASLATIVGVILELMR